MSETRTTFPAIHDGDDLANWMTRMKLTISAAGRELECKRWTLHKYINGEKHLPQRVARHAALIEAARCGQPFGGAKPTYRGQRS